MEPTTTGGNVFGNHLPNSMKMHTCTRGSEHLSLATRKNPSNFLFINFTQMNSNSMQLVTCFFFQLVAMGMGRATFALKQTQWILESALMIFFLYFFSPFSTRGVRECQKKHRTNNFPPSFAVNSSSLTYLLVNGNNNDKKNMCVPRVFFCT